MRIVVFTLLTLLACLNANSVSARGLSGTQEKVYMREAILQKLTVWVKPATGEPIYWNRCRNLIFGCEKQVAKMVDYIFDTAHVHKTDPWLLASVFWHESKFDPFAESTEGAYGVVQLLQRSRWSSDLQFVKQEKYRVFCRTKLGACQRPLIERATFWLKKSFEHCDSVSLGLRMYNSGRCDGPEKYSYFVFAERDDLLLRAREIEENRIKNFATYYNEESAICA